MLQVVTVTHGESVGNKYYLEFTLISIKHLGSLHEFKFESLKGVRLMLCYILSSRVNVAVIHLYIRYIHPHCANHTVDVK